jgi:hypothetical protein
MIKDQLDIGGDVSLADNTQSSSPPLHEVSAAAFVKMDVYSETAVDRFHQPNPFFAIVLQQRKDHIQPKPPNACRFRLLHAQLFDYSAELLRESLQQKRLQHYQAYPI